MRPACGAAGLLLGTLLVLPPADTRSRARDFCPAWLRLLPPGREEVLLRAERAEAERTARVDACRARLRPGLRHALDAECANWSRLMDFEVRAIAERVWAPCADGAG